MRSLPKPRIDTLGNYELCVQGKLEPLRTRLAAFSPVIRVSMENYDRLGLQARFFEFAKFEDWVSYDLSSEDVGRVYSERMVPEGSPGRSVYDALVISSAKCPYCSHGKAIELDHYLPKSLYAELALTAYNLVPSCRNCNKEKLNAEPTSEDQQYIHPYYDNIENIIWLESLVCFNAKDEPVITFGVSSTLPDNTLRRRIEFHFTSLKINQTYSVEVADELSAIYDDLIKIFENAGANAVREHLREVSVSRSRPNRNSWQAALYRGLSSSDKFCNMEWRL